MTCHATLRGTEMHPGMLSNINLSCYLLPQELHHENVVSLFDCQVIKMHCFLVL